MNGSGAVHVYSAVTGAIVRTVVVGSSATAGRDFAVVGPSGRYVYFVDATGPARVPLTGGPLQRLPQPPSNGTEVVAVYADRTDTKLVETIGYADDVHPHHAVVMSVGSTAVTDLGAANATGWSPDGSLAYITITTTQGASSPRQTAPVDVGLYAVSPSRPAARDGRDLTSQSPGDDGACSGGSPSRVTAVSPDGIAGWVLGGCSSKPAGLLTYDFTAYQPQLSLSGPTLPADDDGFVAASMQYTPAGTVVIVLTHQDCIDGSPIVVVGDETDKTPLRDLPGPRCTR